MAHRRGRRPCDDVRRLWKREVSGSRGRGDTCCAILFTHRQCLVRTGANSALAGRRGMSLFSGTCCAAGRLVGGRLTREVSPAGAFRAAIHHGKPLESRRIHHRRPYSAVRMESCGSRRVGEESAAAAGRWQLRAKECTADCSRARFEIRDLNLRGKSKFCDTKRAFDCFQLSRAALVHRRPGHCAAGERSAHAPPRKQTGRQSFAKSSPRRRRLSVGANKSAALLLAQTQAPARPDRARASEPTAAPPHRQLGRDSQPT